MAIYTDVLLIEIAVVINWADVQYRVELTCDIQNVVKLLKRV